MKHDLEAKAFRWTELSADTPMTLLERRRVIGKQAMISHVTLRKGCFVPTHAHDNEQFACILSGKLRFVHGAEGDAGRHELEVGAGEVMHLPSRVPHSAEAVEDTVVLDVFSPPSATTGIDRHEEFDDLMASDSLQSLTRLKEALQQLPGIGPRSAERLAFHILREPRDYAARLADAVLSVKDKVIHCSQCFNLTESDPCAICSDPRRDRGEVWVVEQPKDLMALEAVGMIRGVYHVLMGVIAPLEGIEPEHLTLDALVRRVKAGGIREVVLALNPTLEGDGTALHIQSLLQPYTVKITRPARGLAVGSQLEYASAGMLESAIRGRSAL